MMQCVSDSVRSTLLLLLLAARIALHAGEVPPLSKVSLQLQWLDQFQFAGYYIALEKGFYRDVGLDVSIKPFVSGMRPVEAVLSGAAEYGIGRSSLLIDRSKGAPIVVLAATFQSTPDILLALKRSGIREIKDIVGKRVMLTADAADSLPTVSMLKANGIEMDQIIRQDHTSRLQDLIDGKTDLMASYASNEPYHLRELGIDYVSFAPGTYGFNFYSDLLFTTEAEIRDHPRRAEAFLQASLQGWEYAFSHIEESARIIFEHYNTQNKSLESLIFEGETLKSLAYNGQTPLGGINREKLHSILDLYRVMGVIHKQTINWERFIHPAARSAQIRLTPKERQFIVHKSLRLPSTHLHGSREMMISSVDYPVDAIGHHLLERIAAVIGIPIDMQQIFERREALDALNEGRGDIALSIDGGREPPPGMRYSAPLMSFSYVIAAREKEYFITSLSAFNGRTVALRDGVPILDDLRRTYPKVRLERYPDTASAIRALHAGDVDAVVDLIPFIGHALEEYDDQKIQIKGTLDVRQPIRFLLRDDNPLLLGLINKGIAALPHAERDAVTKRFLEIDIVDRIDSGTIMQITLAGVALTTLLLYRQRRLQRFNERLLQLATTDKLTQINNRLQLDKTLDEEIRHFRRYGRPLTLILLDIDNFKSINDTFGHLTGDIALTRLAKLLETHLRETDVLGRWGGEEFLIVCRETDAKGGMALADTLKERIGTHRFKEIEHLSCSFGVTEAREDDTTESIIKRVDNALYAAKNSGKNRIVMH
jgi:polar amino acid transport system substrate-binding protein